ncbi:MAG: universal stress protein [Acidobacteriota bacterium]
MIEIKKILIPTDFSDYSQLALKYAIAMAESFKARIYLMHVCEHGMSGLGTEAYHFAVPEFFAEIAKNEQERLEEMAREVRDRGVEVETVFTTGRAYIDIVHKAKELDVDVITLATHGRQGLSHLVFGSTAEKVVRLAPCPVLTIKHPEHEFVK